MSSPFGPALVDEQTVSLVGMRFHARVAVRKPHVALGGPLAYAEVCVERGAASPRGVPNTSELQA